MIHDFYKIVEKPIGAGTCPITTHPPTHPPTDSFIYSSTHPHTHPFIHPLTHPLLSNQIQGGFGVVCVGSHRETGETVAIKQLPKKTIREKKVKRESSPIHPPTHPTL